MSDLSFAVNTVLVVFVFAVMLFVVMLIVDQRRDRRDMITLPVPEDYSEPRPDNWDYYVNKNLERGCSLEDAEWIANKACELQESNPNLGKGLIWYNAFNRWK